MGSNITPTQLRGLLLPDPRFTYLTGFSSTLSSLTQAGPLAGVPVAQQDSEMVLEGLGTQTAATQLQVRTARAGHPGVDAARFVWKYSTDTDWRGWDPPVSLTGFEFIDRSTTANEWTNWHARTLDDGTIVVVADRLRRYVRCWTRNPSTGVWTNTEVYDRGSSQTFPTWPCVVVLPNQKLLCFFWSEAADGTYQIRNYVSSDSGATWIAGQKGCLDEAIDPTDYQPGRIRGDHLNDQITLVVHVEEQTGPEDQLRQYASNDLGATLDLVAEWTGESRKYADVLAHGDKLYIAVIADTGGTTPDYAPYVRSIASCYEDVTAVDGVLMQSTTDTMEWATQAGGLFTAGELTLWDDEDGVLWVMGREHATGANQNYELAVRASFDGGDTWAEVGGGPADHEGTSTWRGMDDSTYPAALAAVAHRGRTLVIHRFAANPGTADDSLCAMWLGGYTTVCLAQETGKGTVSPRTVSGWTNTWLPYDMPEDGPTYTASSTGTATLGPAGLAFLTLVAQTEMRLASNLPGTLDEGVTFLGECKLEDNQCRVEIRWNDSVAEEYEIAVIVEETRIVLYDLVAGAEIDHVDTTDGVTGYVQILVDCTGNNVVAHYRPVTASGDREWIEVGTSGACVDNGAITAPGHRVRWGQFDSSISYWRMAHFASDEYTGEHLYGQDNWGDLLGRSYMPTPVFVDGGTSIQAIDGPTFRNEDWHIDTRYEHGVERMHPEIAASPRQAWRSTDDATLNTIAWAMTQADDIREITPFEGGLVGVHLADINFRTCSIWGRTGAGAWVQRATIDAASGMTGLKWTRAGRIVRPDATGATGCDRFFPHGALVGSYFDLDGQPRRIVGNTAGIWSTATTGTATPVSITLEEATESTDLTSGTAGAIWANHVTAVFPQPSVQYEAYRLYIAAQTTSEGYFRVGTRVIGHVALLGWQYSRGRRMERLVPNERTWPRSGVRRSRQPAPARRALEAAWTEGVDTAPITLSDAAPDFFLNYTGGSPTGARGDAPYSLAGIFEQLGGGVRSCVYLSGFTLPSSAGNVVIVNNRDRHLHGTIVSESFSADNVIGDEWADDGAGEVFRIGTIRIEEEV